MVCVQPLYLIIGDFIDGLLIAYSIARHHHRFLILCHIVAVFFNMFMAGYLSD